MTSVSSKPSVVIRPVLAPERVSSVLSTTVEPCMKSAVRASSSSVARPMSSAAAPTAASTPSAKSGGVESALPRRTGSPAANSTASVQVPPTSVATT